MTSHDPASRGWIGFDLDGTLAAHVREGQGPYEIGPPIPEMVDRLRRLLDKGYDCRILTARVALIYANCGEQHAEVRRWVFEHIGRWIPVQPNKDGHMWVLFDDRAVAVERNTGRLLSPCPSELI